MLGPILPNNDIPPPKNEVESRKKTKKNKEEIVADSVAKNTRLESGETLVANTNEPAQAQSKMIPTDAQSEILREHHISELMKEKQITREEAEEEIDSFF